MKIKLSKNFKKCVQFLFICLCLLYFYVALNTNYGDGWDDCRREINQYYKDIDDEINKIRNRLDLLEQRQGMKFFI